MAHARRSVRGALVLLALAALAACATRRDVVASKLKGQGTQRVYAVTVDQAWTISKAILRFEPLGPIEEHRSEGYMLTSDDPSSLAPATYIGVFVEPDGSASAKVTVVNKRRTPTQAYASLSEGAFHRKFSELLGVIEAVGPIRGQKESSTGQGADRPELGDGGTDGLVGGRTSPADGGRDALPASADGGS